MGIIAIDNFVEVIRSLVCNSTADLTILSGILDVASHSDLSIFSISRDFPSKPHLITYYHNPKESPIMETKINATPEVVSQRRGWRFWVSDNFPWLPFSGSTKLTFV